MNLPQNTLNNLKICSDTDAKLLYKISCLMIDKSSENGILTILLINDIYGKNSLFGGVFAIYAYIVL